MIIMSTVASLNGGNTPDPEGYLQIQTYFKGFFKLSLNNIRQHYNKGNSEAWDNMKNNTNSLLTKGDILAETDLPKAVV